MIVAESKFYREDIEQSKKESVPPSYLYSVSDDCRKPQGHRNIPSDKPPFNQDHHDGIYIPSLNSKGSDSFVRLVALLSFGFISVGFLIITWPKISDALITKPELTIPQLIDLPSVQTQKLVQIDLQIANLGKAVSMLLARLENIPEATQTPKTDSETQLVKVIALKANLRVAPSKEASAVMAVSQGTKLLVHSREPNWLRVYAPSGELFWVSEEVVAMRN